MAKIKKRRNLFTDFVFFSDLLKVRGSMSRSGVNLLKVRRSMSRSGVNLLKVRGSMSRSGVNLLKVRGSMSRSGVNLLKVGGSMSRSAFFCYCSKNIRRKMDVFLVYLIHTILNGGVVIDGVYDCNFNWDFIV